MFCSTAIFDNNDKTKLSSGFRRKTLSYTLCLLSCFRSEASSSSTFNEKESLIDRVEFSFLPSAITPSPYFSRKKNICFELAALRWLSSAFYKESCLIWWHHQNKRTVQNITEKRSRKKTKFETFDKNISQENYRSVFKSRARETTRLLKLFLHHQYHNRHDHLYPLRVIKIFVLRIPVKLSASSHK